MSKLKITFALLAVLVVLTAPAYASSETRAEDDGAPSASTA